MDQDDENRRSTETTRRRPAPLTGATGLRSDADISGTAALTGRTQTDQAGRPLTSGGGSALRRQPGQGPQDGPQAGTRSWVPTQPTGYRPNVDNAAEARTQAERRPAVSSNVDNTANTESDAKAPVKLASSNVDNVADGLAEVVPGGTKDMPVPAKLARPPVSSVRRPGGPRVQSPLPAVRTHDGVVPSPSPDRLAELRREFANRAAQAKSSGDAVLGSSATLTRTPETLEQYEKRGRQLLGRYRREMNMDPAVAYDPREFASWFISMRPSLSAPTWRSYKQAVLYVLTAVEGIEASDAVAIIEADSAWEGEMAIRPPKKKEPVRKKNTANKAKTIPFQDYEKLDAYLRLRAWSKHAQTLRDWLRAGLATGLRPDEWQYTEVVQQPDPAPGYPDRLKTILFVLNAKSTNGRANGVMRTLDISDFDEETIYAVMRMSDNGMSWFRTKTFDSMQSQCAQILYRANEAIWKRREATTYALYTCRHQFILNMRAIDLRDEEISALIGHLVTDTQLEHYGKRGKGWSIDKITNRPKADPDEVSTVRRTLTMAEQRSRLEGLLNLRRKRAARDGVPEESLEHAEVTPDDR